MPGWSAALRKRACGLRRYSSGEETSGLRKEVVGPHAAGGAAGVAPAGVGDRLAHVGEARGPQRAHRRARELVILRLRRVRGATIDEMNDRDAPAACALGQYLDVRV